jgi:hypothetical protein
MNKAKFIGSLLLAFTGAVITFYPIRPAIPNQSELVSAHGTLISSKFRSKVGSEFQIEGISRNFVYQSHGRLCGNVHDKLLAELGKPISVMYLPTPNTGWFINSHLLRVFEITGQEGSICSYDQVTDMIQGDFEVLPLMGSLMLLIGLANAFSTLSTVHIKNTNNTKTRNEHSTDLEAEEGERIIGEQWKNSSQRTTRLPDD